MTSNIFSILNTAKLGLLAQQLAMEVTGNNVANVETAGYSRQQVQLTPNIPRTTAVGQLGTGVLVAGIERVHDQFLFEQIVGEGNRTGEFRVRQDIFAQLDILFNENLGRSLNGEFSAFFASLQDLSSNPGGLAERADLLAQAQSLSSVFNHLGNELFHIQRSIDFALVDEVSEINALATEIAKLNEEIHGSETGVLVANEQRDRRDLLIKQLSEKIDITPLDEMNGQVSITLGDGTPLVLRSTAYELSTALNGDNQSFRDVFVDRGAAGLKNITATIQGGEVRGYLDMRDTELSSVIDRLDLLAAGLTREFNRVHQQGYGLDGGTGVDFFAPLTAKVFTATQNTGSASVAVQVASPADASIDRFRLTFTGPGAFDLVNETTGAALGNFAFTSGTPFNLAGGLAVTITGTPDPGDEVEISTAFGAARAMAVDGAVLSDIKKIAAGLTQAGDGDNAIALADLQNAFLFDSDTLSPTGTSTLDEFYSTMVSQVGVKSFSAQAGFNQQEGVLLQLNNRRDSISGVSIDEEMIQMIKFQQAFNASARMIGVVEEMFDTLIAQL